jgi:cystinosin
MVTPSLLHATASLSKNDNTTTNMPSVNDPLLGDDAEYTATPLLRKEQNQPSDGNDEPTTTAAPRNRNQIWKLFLSPLTDDTGSGCGVVAGLVTIILVGTSLGLALPQNPNLPTPWYRAMSSVIGYTYFICWSVSFYPQTLSNFSRKSTQGLSADFCGLNVIGFACYSVYNLTFFCSTSIQEMYKERHGGSENTVQSNDVAFAVHAFVLSTLTLLQIAYYNGIRAIIPNRVIGWVMMGILATILAYMAVVGFLHKSTWLDFLYLLSYMKIFVTLIKYIPQVILNVRRKSTEGWSIWNILLDFSGGLLSDMQVIFDCADMGDWTGITGNLAKFLLGCVSIVFDVVFMLQHYVLYSDASGDPAVAAIDGEASNRAECDDDDQEEPHETV